MTTLALALAAAVTGLALGSFVTVLTYRLPRKESVIRPGSKCPGCGHPIKPADNIPVVSYALRRGKCRNCGEPISVRYPLTELASAGLFVAAMLGLSPDLYAGLVFGTFFVVLLAISLIDLERQIIPNAIVYPSVIGFAIAVVLGWAIGAEFHPVMGLLGLLGFGGLLLLIVLIYPKGMGMGDVKLAALIGLVVGAHDLGSVVVAAVLGMVLGGIGGVLVLAFRGGENQKMPFGPFLAAGAVLATFFGPSIASWYLGYFG